MKQPSGGGAVLVVDDDPDIRETLAELLADEGFAVATSENGADALARLASGEPIRLVLLDLMMPVLDGYGFLERQRGDAALSQVPVVVITAGAVDRSRTGDLDVIAKPLDLEKLLRLLHLRSAPPPGP